ncbi:hypothetical protein AURDEDRAFT_160817 [Auricularia subglabra TFB-10046 SS5]|nr:hypothetical protein AURDEDRAFT_160817 [Auricularia subglabra TFB-10046 SS5]
MDVLLDLLEPIFQGLADPRNPDVCSACAVRVHNHFMTDIKVFARFLSRHHHTLLSRIMAFLIVERSSVLPLVAELHASFRRCPRRRDPQHVAISEEYHFDLASPIHSHSVISALCPLVSTSIVLTPDALMKRKFGRRFWPTGMDDLLPGGVDGPAGLLFHFTTLGDSQVFGIFVQTFILCRSRIYPHVMVDPVRSTFVSALCSHLSSYTDDLLDPNVNLRFPAVQIQWLTLLLNSIRQLGNSEWPRWRSLFSGHERQVIASIRCVERLSIDPNAKHILRDFALEMYRSLGIHCLCGIPLHLAEHVYQRYRAIGGPFGYFKGLLHGLSARTICSGPQCPKQPHEDSGRLFRCGRCMLFRYCSRQCQKDHWRHAAYPHKAVCHLLRDVKEVTALCTTATEFEAACGPLGIQQQGLVPISANVTQVSNERAAQELHRFSITDREELRQYLGMLCHPNTACPF